MTSPEVPPMPKRWPAAKCCKIFKFCASHYLPNVPSNHPCGRVHGHNYVVEVEVRGEMNPTRGWVEDFGSIKDNMKPILETLDHHNLNDIDGLGNPTAEVLAGWIMGQYPVMNVYRIRVWETDSCWAEVVNTEGKWPREMRM